MKWTKLKKQLENRLAASLTDRMKYQATTYGPHSGYSLARAWITLDKREILSFSTVAYWVKHWKLRRQLQKINKGEDFRDPASQQEYYRAHEEAQQILHRQDIYTRSDFLDAAHEYLLLSIEDALNHENALIRGLAVLDRRFGKRRLKMHRLRPAESNMVRKLFEIRLMAEKPDSL